MSKRAFSLAEVMLALCIAGVLLVLAIPSLASLRDSGAVRGAMGEVAASFSAAREMAITRRAMVAILLDTVGGAVEIRSSGVPVLRRPLRATYGIVLGSNRDSAVYDPRGIGYGVTNLTVTVRRGAKTDTLTMSRLGRVKW